MKTFVFTLDDNNATRFLNKRQSSDRIVASRIVLAAGASLLFMKKGSESFFAGTDFVPQIAYFENLDELPDDCFVFFEEPLSIYDLKLADKIIVYRWNRIYPSVTSDRIDLKDFVKAIGEKFEGNSHSKITIEEYYNE